MDDIRKDVSTLQQRVDSLDEKYDKLAADITELKVSHVELKATTKSLDTRLGSLESTVGYMSDRLDLLIGYIQNSSGFQNLTSNPTRTAQANKSTEADTSTEANNSGQANNNNTSTEIPPAGPSDTENAGVGPSSANAAAPVDPATYYRPVTYPVINTATYNPTNQVFGYFNNPAHQASPFNPANQNGQFNQASQFYPANQTSQFNPVQPGQADPTNQGYGYTARLKASDIGYFDPSYPDPADIGMVTAGSDVIYTDIQSFTNRLRALVEGQHSPSQILSWIDRLLRGQALEWWNSELPTNQRRILRKAGLDEVIAALEDRFKVQTGRATRLFMTGSLSLRDIAKNRHAMPQFVQRKLRYARANGTLEKDNSNWLGVMTNIRDQWEEPISDYIREPKAKETLEDYMKKIEQARSGLERKAERFRSPSPKAGPSQQVPSRRVEQRYQQRPYRQGDFRSTRGSNYPSEASSSVSSDTRSRNRRGTRGGRGRNRNRSRGQTGRIPDWEGGH
ncbi:putative probable transposable element [Rosellinia necatrix]|uniref:Putative probable transposable element n=1 Tax=Rosellinia necatrix TaxID=77044 RepID=A0A1W2TMY4_ROSNE|nr:putative probable transposable element [Rosellinia necatrix]